MAAKQRNALGRGLSALIPPAPPQQRPEDRNYFLCPIEQIRPQKGQPRRYFDEQRLAELVASLKQQGMVQPLLVRPDGEHQYTLIAGERRWRAAQRAGLHEVPVVLRKVDDLVAFELALVENLQREDLNPIEESEAYARLLADHGYTQERLADQIGKERSTVANSLRLLKLPEAGRRALVAGAISAGHARALLGLGTDARGGELFGQALKRVVGKGLSVRQTEALVKTLRDASEGDGGKGARPALSPNARDLQERLCRGLGTRVRLQPGAEGRGRIEISYASIDELDRLLEVLLP